MRTFRNWFGRRPLRWLGVVGLAWGLTPGARPATAVLGTQSAQPLLSGAAQSPGGAAAAPPSAPANGSASAVADSVAAEAALAALALGRLPAAYLALAPLAAGRTGPTSGALLPWSARVAQARLLICLGAWNAARAVLPPRPRPGEAADAPWREAAWQLTRAELERTAGRPQAALAAGRRAAQLLTRLTSPAHPLRVHGWLEVAMAHSVAKQYDSAVFYAERARALLPVHPPRPATGWPAGLASRLAFPPLPALQVYILLGSVLGSGLGSESDQEAGSAFGPIQIGPTRFASRSAAAATFLDSAARLSQRGGADAAQLVGLGRVQGLYWANRALADDDEAAARHSARRADAAFVRAAKLARTSAERATIETIRGEFTSKFDSPEAALPIYQQALAHLLGTAASTEPGTDPAALPPAFGAAAGQDALFYLLEQQAATYRDRYAATADPRDLDRFFVNAIRLTDVLAYRREQARRSYAAETPGRDAATVDNNYALGVEAAEARFRRRKLPADLALAFRITQNAKAWRLLTRVGGERATARLLADEHLLGRYQRAAAALRRWEELATLSVAYPDLRAAPGLVGAADSMRAARQALETITMGLQQRHPTLYARAFSGSYALPLTEAQASLPPDGRTAAVEFLRRTSFEDGLHRESVYAFVVQPTGTHLLRLTLPTNFPGLVDSLVEALARPGSRAYPGLAARAYALVLKPVAQVLGPGVRQLVIAPDGELWRLPFEALLTRPLAPTEARQLDYRRLPYALRRWSFTYAHSLTLRARARDGATATGPARLLALAPFSDPTRGLALPFSGRLLTQLARTTGGAFFAGAAASRAALQRGAAQADVLHLATHARADLADPAASALALADGPVPLSDLFRLPLHPRLVVLSACQTGVGRIGGPSESATSLSWGFTYAGAGSTVATLWQVDDAATAALLGRFYRHLHGHEAKNVALHRAKLVALDSARTAAAADPFYWAGLVLTGDERPLTLAPAGPIPATRRPAQTRAVGALLAALAGAALLGAGAWWWRRQRVREAAEQAAAAARTDS